MFLRSFNKLSYVSSVSHFVFDFVVLACLGFGVPTEDRRFSGWSGVGGMQIVREQGRLSRLFPFFLEGSCSVLLLLLSFKHAFDSYHSSPPIAFKRKVGFHAEFLCSGQMMR